MIYDCLFPNTVGGAERWYRNLAERLAAEGHELTYATMRQWDRGEEPDLQEVRVLAVGPRMALYTNSGRRRIVQALACECVRAKRRGWAAGYLRQDRRGRSGCLPGR